MIRLHKTSELAILREFQKRMVDLNLDDPTCTRFLKAREFNLDAAESMLRKSMQWRTDCGIDEILSCYDPPAFCAKDLPFQFTGRSLSGGPVIWLPLGSWKAKYWLERGQKDEMLRYVFYILEAATKKIHESDDIRATVVISLEELTFSKASHIATLRILYDSFQALEQNYPEILEHLLVVNAPWTFTIAFNFIKPILSQHTLNKIQIYGSDAKNWIAKLKEFMEIQAIPHIACA